MPKFERILWTSLVLIGFAAVLSGQQQQSGGGGSSVTISAALPSGSNVIGKMGIDQTTPGTTNLVSIGSTGTVGLLAGAAGIGDVINDASLTGIGDVVAEPGSATAGAFLPALPGGTGNIGFTRATRRDTP